MSAQQVKFNSRAGLDGNSLTGTNFADPVNNQDLATKNFSSNANNLTSGTLAAAQLPALTGDATAVAGTGALTLASSGVTAGTYGSATAVPQFVVDAKGRITTSSNVTITPAWSSITGANAGVLATTLTGLTTASGAAITSSSTVLQAFGQLQSQLNYFNTYVVPVTQGGTGATTAAAGLAALGGVDSSTLGAASGVATLTASSVLTPSQFPALTGDVTTAGGALTTTLASTGVTAGVYGDTNHVGSFTVDSKGRITAASKITIYILWTNVTTTPTTLAGYGITDAAPLLNPVFTGTAGLVPPTGTTAQRPTTPTAGETRYNSSLKVLETWNGTAWLTNTSPILQVKTGIVTPTSGTSVIAFSNTKPTTSNGTLLWSQAVTPTQTGSFFTIQFSGLVDVNVGGILTSRIVTLTLFNGTTLVGLASAYFGGTGEPNTISLNVRDTPSGATTYSCYIGVTGGTWYFGQGASFTMGGTNNASWVIEETLT